MSQWHWVAVRSVRPTPVLCAARANSCKAPGTLCAFDVLSIEDEDLRALPQLDRKERLRQLVDGLSLVHYVERLDAQGEALFAKFANSIWRASSHAGGFQLQGRLATGVGQGEESELVAAKGVEVRR